MKRKGAPIYRQDNFDSFVVPKPPKLRHIENEEIKNQQENESNEV